MTARWQTLRAKLIKALARKSAASGLKLHQEQLAVQCCMQTRSREAAKAGKPRITELLGVRVLSAPAAGCSHNTYSEQLPVISAVQPELVPGCPQQEVL